MALQASRRLCRQAFGASTRLFSSLPAEKAVETGFGEFVQISDRAGVPVLIRLAERPWGAVAALPAAKLSEAGFAGADLPSHIAVVRDAFGTHDAGPRVLSKEVAALGPHKVAVAASVAEPHNKLVVDDYELDAEQGRYRLRTCGADLYRFLRAHGLHVVHVPDVAAAAAGALNSSVAASRGLKQSTNEVLMVSPTAFGFNDQAAQDNTFMNSSSTGGGGGVTQQVLREFSGLVHELTEVAGVKVNLFQHSLAHGTPDAVFPNNWFSTHPAGEGAGGVREPTLVLYPMKCPNRQAERRQDIRDVLSHWGYPRVLDLTAEEQQQRYFEGTGVLVLDRINGVAYVALSERADAELAQRWVQEMGYREAVTFRSTDAKGGTVYHTNVMMAVGTDVAVVCLESVEDAGERARLAAKLGATHAIVDITREQMAALCGNALELEDGRGLPVLAMSTRAYNAFTPDQRAVLRRHVTALHHAPIDTLEHVGGGGVRCTLAEIFR